MAIRVEHIAITGQGQRRIVRNCWRATMFATTQPGIGDTVNGVPLIDVLGQGYQVRTGGASSRSNDLELDLTFILTTARVAVVVETWTNDKEPGL